MSLTEEKLLMNNNDIELLNAEFFTANDSRICRYHIQCPPGDPSCLASGAAEAQVGGRTPREKTNVLRPLHHELWRLGRGI